MPAKPKLPTTVSPRDATLRIDPQLLGFVTTDELDPLAGVIAQDRAVEAIEFALGVDNAHFNLFVAGPPGTGRSTVAPEMARRVAQSAPKPPDICYVRNFRDPDRPRVLTLPAGQGRLLAEEMRRFVDFIERNIPAALSSRDYRSRRQTLLEEAIDARAVHLQKLSERARTVGIGVDDNGEGLQLVPLAEDGTQMAPEAYHGLSEAERKAIDEHERSLRDDILEYLDESQQIQEKSEEKLDRLDDNTAQKVLKPALDRIRRKLKPVGALKAFLEEVQDDVLNTLHLFVEPEPEPSQALLGQSPRPASEAPNRYEVNLAVDNEKTEGGPVVIEWNPTWANLIGRIERRMSLGALETDHMLIRAGALLRANGGVLVLPARELLTTPFVYPALKRWLREGMGTIEDPDEIAMATGVSAITLRPEPVPVRVRVVLIGSLDDYLLLRELDDDFDRLFKVRADFDVSTARTNGAMRDFARWVASRTRHNGSPPLTADGVAALIELASRRAGRRDELSLELMPLNDVIVEAAYWAQKAGAAIVDRAHVELADAKRRDRDGLFRQRALEAYQRGSVLVDLSGTREGQVNALAVTGIGDYDYGMVSRITAKAFAGSSGVVNLERETELSGQIHTKATLILQGYLGGLYAQHQALALSASITFEQNYGLVEGDSASVAETVALLSCLAGIGVRQDVAVTGSMSQHGEVQPVGGVNEKIEGFFDICAMFGLTGTQGVVLPSRNLDDLNLAPRVVSAMEAGRFSIWPVDHIDEAIERLLGLPAGRRSERTGRFTARSVHARVAARLAQMVERERRGDK